MKISIHTSVEDLTSTLRGNIERYEIADFDEAIETEKHWRNRSTVLKLLERAKKAKQKGSKHL